MNQSTINFLVKTLGADEAAREMDKITRAAQKAGTSVKKYLSTSSGEEKLLALQTKAATARAEQQASATDKTAAATDRASASQRGYFGHIAKTTVQSALINKLFLEMVDVSGQAIQQVDLFNNFPATMKSMGQSTQDASTAMQALQSYVGQVGGNLGDATSYVTRFTGATKDVKSATAIFVGLNNALIAGDSSLEEQRQAAIQFAQALERGKPDMREWRTLTQNMSFQLNQVAVSMGYVNANELGTALTTGKESMAAFTVALTKLSTGQGEIAKQARARMTGMQFSFNVLKNTMVQGLAAIIQAIGRENIVSFFSFLTQVVRVLTEGVVKLIGVLITLFNFFARLFGLPAIKLQKDMAGVASGTGSAADNAGDLADGLGGANDEADKLNKSLASFDKMNVLPDKTSGKDPKDSGAGGSNFDPAQLGELGNLFDGIGGNLEEASKWAKIFAGVIGGLLGIKFAQAIIDQVAGVAKSFQTAKDGIGKFATSIKNLPSTVAGGFGKVKTLILGTVDDAGVASGGLKAQFASLGKFLTNPYVLLAAAIAVVVGGLIYLYNTNQSFKKGFDEVWKGAGDAIKGFADILMAILKPALDALKKAWDGLVKALEPITVHLQPLIDKFKEWLKSLFPGVNAMEIFGNVIGVAAKVIAALVFGPLALLIVGVTLLATGVVWLIAKIIELGTAVVTWITGNFGGAKDAVVGFVTGGVDLIVGAFKAAKDAVVDFVTNGIDFIGKKFDEFKKWIDDHKQALINWGIVITTFLLPKIVQIGAQFAVVAAKAAVETAKMVASSVADAAKTAAVWVTKELPKIIAGFAKTSASAVIEFAKSSASAVKNFAIMSAQAAIHGAKIVASFAASSAKAAAEFALMVVKFVAGLAVMAAQLAIKAVQMAISWALALGPIGLAIAVVAGAIALIIANWDTVKEVATKVWAGVMDIINGFMDWLKANWPLVLAIITGPIGLVVLAIVKNWDTIKAAFQAALDFIKSVWNTVVDFFQGVWNGIKTVFMFVVDFYKGIFQGAWDAIKVIWNAVTGFFQGVWQGIQNVFSGVKTWLTDRFRDAWNGITGIFGDVANWFRVNVVDRIVNAFTGIKDRITGFFSGVWNGLADGLKNALNTLLNLPLKIPSVTVAGKTIGGQTLIPRLAQGGIIDQATLAVVGESGKEAIVPLENNTEWVDKLAAKINSAAGSGNGGQPIQLVVQIGEDKVATKIIELINEKTQMSGRNMIYV